MTGCQLLDLTALQIVDVCTDECGAGVRNVRWKVDGRVDEIEAQLVARALLRRLLIVDSGEGVYQSTLRILSTPAPSSPPHSSDQSQYQGTGQRRRYKEAGVSDQAGCLYWKTLLAF